MYVRISVCHLENVLNKLNSVKEVAMELQPEFVSYGITASL